MKAAEIRAKFLKFFESQGHRVVESSSLVPSNDPTLLFTNAGMVQFKDVFLGLEKRDYQRAVTAQKCVRAGGKHNDLEKVGFTARHHTFFEMLGNFSFGDYFKKEAIHFAWAFVTRELRISKDVLYVTVFQSDDEAAQIWEKQEQVPKERIFRFGEKDNFWSMGETGPCGPCTEIFVDRGKKHGCGKSTCTVGCECDRFMEIWNLVFMQFNRSVGGKMEPLPRPSVDTGAGLERIASFLQGVETNYDTDVFQEIISRTEKLSGASYRSELATSFRVVADHARAATFLIADGVLPSNEGRGYVLRRIMRRAIRHGRKLGFQGPFFARVCGFVMDQMREAYPALEGQRSFVEKAVTAEEEQFLKTLDRGIALLDEAMKDLRGKSLSGEIAFKLYDTYGFPLDLTRVICEESGVAVDEAGFDAAMGRQRSESRKHWKGSGEETVEKIYHEVAESLKSRGKLVRFTGYESLSETSECLALLVRSGAGLRVVPDYVFCEGSPDTVEALFAVTPFYGESGGQAGDRGRVMGGGFEAVVLDVQKPLPEWVVVKLRATSGRIAVGGKYLQEVDALSRSATAKNHTATHLLQWALREVLGAHVKQAGSLVNSELLRFDFTHFQAMTSEELKRVEDLINVKIWNGDGVQKREMPKDDAIRAGAIAMFGEKYGDRVRVVSVGDYSTELCGGTHVDRSSEIHLFKIINESGIAAGVRRIIAYTSRAAFDHLRGEDHKLKQLRDVLRASSTDEIPIKLERLQESEKAARREIERLMAEKAGDEVHEILKMARPLGAAQFLGAICQPNPNGVKHLREIADQLKQKAPNGVIVLGMKSPEGDKAFLLSAKGPTAPETVSAGQIISEISPKIGGRGGGKPDLAQAGGNDPSRLSEALEAAFEHLRKQLSL